MAERPDLEYQLPILDRELKGKRVDGVTVQKPIVLRLAIDGTPQGLLQGLTFASVKRRGHFALFMLNGVELAIAPMLAGRFVLQPQQDKIPGDAAMSFELNDGRRLVYRDDVQMGKVYVIAPGAYAGVPNLEHVGVDVLSKAFTFELFNAMIEKRRDQVRVFLMDKAALDSFGNAYADEVLWAAKVHPKTTAKTLTPDERKALHAAIIDVTRDAIATIEKAKPPLDEKLRDFVMVRNRHGEPCPRCGTKIRRAGVHGHDTFYCPECQPETRKSGIVSWKR